jgi:hypothetical protein
VPRAAANGSSEPRTILARHPRRVAAPDAWRGGCATPGCRMTLDQFLKDNRAELIERARIKVAGRSSPPSNPTELEHGVPLFLSQLSDTLEDQGPGGTEDSTRASRAANAIISEGAAQHGRDLLKFGFTIEQVVHDYGDVCQAVTELAEERGATLSIAEFHTLNRCLDNAIAGAVSSWSQERDLARADKADKERVSGTFLRDFDKLLEQVNTLFDVIRGGRVGVSGATGALVVRALLEMRALVDKAELSRAQSP